MDEKLGQAWLRTAPCPVCGTDGRVLVQVDDFLRWSSRDRPLIQDCFPTLTREQREQVLTGIHPSCWDKLFPADEEEVAS